MKKSRFTPTPFGLRVIEARKALGWTQLELAQHAGLEPATVSRIETGQTAHPTTAYAYILATVLGIPESEVPALLVGNAPPVTYGGSITTVLRAALREAEAMAPYLNPMDQDMLARVILGNVRVYRSRMKGSE